MAPVNDKEIFYEAMCAGLVEVGLDAYCHIIVRNNPDFKSFALAVDYDNLRFQISIGFESGTVFVRRIGKRVTDGEGFVLADPKLFEKIKGYLDAYRTSSNSQSASR